MAVVRIKGEEKKSRAIRVEKELWDDFADACLADGVSRNHDLVEYMRHKVRAHKRELRRTGT